MSGPVPNVPRRRRTGPFGPAREILPERGLECLAAGDSLLVALERLCDGGFNQAPVKDGAECLGVLRLFEVIKQLLLEQWFRDRLRNMPVGNHIDLSPRYIGPDEWVDVGFDWQEDDLALVGSPKDLRGMLTATDILGRLTDYAHAFVFLERIELDTRALFELLLPLPECEDLVRDALTTDGRTPPSRLENYEHLEFGHYALIFGRESTFARLEPVCIWGRKKLVRSTEELGGLRNSLLHFRARASARDVDTLERFSTHASRALERAEELVAKRRGHE